MYSWGEETDDWAKPGTYKFDAKTASVRAEAKTKSEAEGPRTYHKGAGPVEQMVTAKKRIDTESPDPVAVAVDVTGSMATWPAEIFDRLPLFYQTLSQYRPDTDIAFSAIGDAGCDKWPLQITDFAQGFSLDGALKAIFGEGGGGDFPESYGIFAWWMNRRCDTPNAGTAGSPTGKPFLIVYGDADMHAKIPGEQLTKLLGEPITGDFDAIEEWQTLCKKWEVWFIRRPTGRVNDHIEKQWRAAVGNNYIHIRDEQRAIDYALCIVGMRWGRLEDVRANMLARQDEAKVEQVIREVTTAMQRATP